MLKKTKLWTTKKPFCPIFDFVLAQKGFFCRGCRSQFSEYVENGFRDKEKNAASSIKNLPEEKEKLPTIKNKEQDRLPSSLTINNSTRKNINFKTGKPENTTIFHSQTE